MFDEYAVTMLDNVDLQKSFKGNRHGNRCEFVWKYAPLFPV